VNPVTLNILTQRIKVLGNLPAMPSVLTVLCEELSAKASSIDVDRVVETISCDKSLTAQCLRLANSALFRQRGDVATVKEAVFALGLWRIRDLAFSCSLPQAFANVCKAVPREVFWRHSLGAAVLSQKIAQEFAPKLSKEAYLCGLLHDIGILVNGVLFPDDFRDVFEESIREKAPLEEMEQRVLGFTHAESGRILADLWRLPQMCAQVIEYHHLPGDSPGEPEMNHIVSCADSICMKNNFDYGFTTEEYPTVDNPNIWRSIAGRFPEAEAYSEEESSKLLETWLQAATALADQAFPAVTVA
jgi:HD-like signal output (HDOD) protein